MPRAISRAAVRMKSLNAADFTTSLTSPPSSFGSGERSKREFAAEVPTRPAPASAVPSTGRGKRPPEPEPDTGGLEPQPT